MASRFRTFVARLFFQDILCEAYDEGREYVQNRIYGDGWWFSHDEPTMNVIHGLARGEDTWTVRDRWHKATGKGRPGIDVPHAKRARDGEA